MMSLYLAERGHEVTGFARRPSSLIKTVVGDASDFALVRRLITAGGFDAAVNCIGVLNMSAERDKLSAVLMNSALPHLLADAAADTSTRIIHMSTDCVFSGKRGGYTEADTPDGDTFYDRSKALGELNDAKNVTLRNSIIGPDINPDGIGLLNWFLLQDSEVNGFTRAIWTGQTTLQLAKTIEAAAREEVSGIINAVPETSISKYELLKLFNRYFRGNRLRINPVDGVAADKSLKRTRYEFGYIIPDYETMIAELATWMGRHKRLYPHYNL